MEQALGRASRGRKKAPTLSRHLPGRHRFPSPTETAVEASVRTITSSGKARRREEIQRDLSVRPAAEQARAVSVGLCTVFRQVGLAMYNLCCRDNSTDYYRLRKKGRWQ